MLSGLYKAWPMQDQPVKNLGIDISFSFCIFTCRIKELYGVTVSILGAFDPAVYGFVML